MTVPGLVLGLMLTAWTAHLGLSIADAAELDACLSRFLTASGEGRSGTEQVVLADHSALAAACDRAWLGTQIAEDAFARMPAPPRVVAEDRLYRSDLRLR
jgi:hypothetical protein